MSNSHAKVMTSVALYPWLKDRLDQTAATLDKSRNWLIANALEEYFDRHFPSPAALLTSRPEPTPAGDPSSLAGEAAFQTSSHCSSGAVCVESPASAGESVESSPVPSGDEGAGGKTTGHVSSPVGANSYHADIAARGARQAAAVQADERAWHQENMWRRNSKQ